jgi:hypothetical protein
LKICSIATHYTDFNRAARIHIKRYLERKPPDKMSVDRQLTDAEIDANIANEARLHKMYPNIGLSISFCSPEELDVIVSPKRIIFLKNVKNCYCFGERTRPSDFIEVTRKGENITYRDIFEALDKIGYSSECGHCFFEGLCYVANSDVQFEMILGS